MGLGGQEWSREPDTERLPDGRLIMRCCCSDPGWAHWKVIERDEQTTLRFTLTRAGARRWARRHQGEVLI